MTDKSELYDPNEHEPLPEGEEAPPPLVHTMAIVRWILLGGMTIFALIMVLHYFELNPWANAASGSKQYHCPMHPTYASSQPGECPICGMNLVEIDASGHEAAVKADTTHMTMDQAKHPITAKPGQYTCPMDPEVISESPGKCSKCGMNLEQVPLAAAGKYTCPMHPEIVRDGPGECPICGMDLVPMTIATDSSVEQADHGVGGAGGLGSAPVPGLVPVTIEPQRLQLIGIRTEKVETRQIDDELRLVGYITPDESRVSNVHFRISGWVQQLFVNETGQAVHKGQPLMSIYSQEVYEAEQNLVQAAARASQPSNDSLLAATRLELLNAAQQRLELLGVPADEVAETLKRGTAAPSISIKSPFDGVVLEKTAYQGGLVSPDQNLFTIADLSTVWILADVYEQDLSRVKIGAEAAVSVDAFPGRPFTGTIQFVYPTLSGNTRTGRVRIELRNPGLELRPGMYGSVRVTNLQGSTLSISSEALMDGGDLKYAFVVHEGTHFEPRLLTVGQRTDNWVEVLSGLREGEMVVSSANFLIDSESRLKAAIAGMGSTKADAHAGHTR